MPVFPSKRGILSSHLRLNLLKQLLQLIHISFLLRPLDSQALCLVWLGDDVEMDVVNLLVSQTAVVL